MDQHLSIRVTQRTQVGDRSIENTFEFDTAPKTAPKIGIYQMFDECAIADALSAAPGKVSGARAKATPEPDLVPGDPADLQEALQAISLSLGSQNNLDDILHAIDALRGPSLEWSPTLADAKNVNFAKAEAAIATLNASLRAGEAQWRMPTRRELESIQDLTKHDPCVDLERYPDTKSGWYWSATPCAWSSARAWVVSFLNGNSDLSHRDYNLAFVRAVRAVPSGQ